MGESSKGWQRPRSFISLRALTDRSEGIICRGDPLQRRPFRYRSDRGAVGRHFGKKLHEPCRFSRFSTAGAAAKGANDLDKG
jgi:hypothetical protein